MKLTYIVKNISIKLQGMPGRKIALKFQKKKMFQPLVKKAFSRKFMFIFFFLRNTLINLPENEF